MVSLSADAAVASPVKVTLTSPMMDKGNDSPKVLQKRPVTPIEWDPHSRTSSYSSSSSTTGSIFSRSNSDPEQPNNTLVAVGGPGSVAAEFNTPVVGYEVMEERTRFTVFKLWIEPKNLCDGWFVFRRYTDFLRLNRKLREIFPGLRLVLPPKKWFGDNFDPCFLEDRLLGLQAYVTNITNHPNISQQTCVREFLCLDSKPDAHDSIEESRARCQSLDRKVRSLKKNLKEKDIEINRLSAELALMKTQKETLLKGLKLECSVTAFTQKNSISSQTLNQNDNSIAEFENYNICKALGIHNVNVTLLHMLENAFGNQNVPIDLQSIDKNHYCASNLSESIVCNSISQTKSSLSTVENIQVCASENCNNTSTPKGLKALSIDAQLLYQSSNGFQSELSSQRNDLSPIHQKASTSS